MAVLTNREARCKAIKCLALQGTQSVVLPIVNLVCECDLCAECLQTSWIVNFLLIAVGGGLVTYIDVWWMLKAIPPWWQWVVKISHLLKVLQMRRNPWNASYPAGSAPWGFHKIQEWQVNLQACSCWGREFQVFVAFLQRVGTFWAQCCPSLAS